MHERRYHLNESSSARLGGSQQLEILPSPNSKQTQSLGASLSDRRITWAPNFLISAVIFIRRRDFNVRLSSSVYYVAHEFHNSAQLVRLYFGNPPIFWISAYILEKRLYFEQAPKLFVCANILGKRQYFMIFCLILLLQIFCVYFQYLFMHFCVRQYFWRNCFET
jgi:hypothetical protein